MTDTTVHSPFGPRKVRQPPPADSNGAASVVVPQQPPQTQFGERKTRLPPATGPGQAAQDGVSSSPFGPRISRGGADRANDPTNVDATQGAKAAPKVGPPVASAVNLSPPVGVRPNTATTPPQNNESSVLSPPASRHIPLSSVERIEGCLLQRKSHQLVAHRRVLAAVRLIQEEYRSFISLSGTPEDRAARRVRLAAAQRRLQERLCVVGLQARDGGSAIAIEEAAAWSLLQRSAVVLQSRSIVLVEERRRENIADEQTQIFFQTFLMPNADIPSFLRPGVERDECSGRSHTVQYERFEMLRLAAREVAERGAITILDEQRQRRAVIDNEFQQFIGIVRCARVAYWDAACAEEAALEDRFRCLICQQRVRFMSLLSRQAAAALALSFLNDDADDDEYQNTVRQSYSESGYRRAIIEKESFYRERMMTAFHERRHFIGLTAVQRAEHAGRCGAKTGTTTQVGIEVREKRERQAIVLAMLRGALMYIQGGAEGDGPERIGMRMGDTHSEYGSRLSITFQEDRERRALEHTLNTDAIHVFLPAIEMRQRQRIVDQERNALRGIVHVIGVVPLLFCLQEEPAPRRRLFEAWQHDTIGHIFQFARIRLMDQETRRRVHTYQQQYLFHERLMACNYLARVELTERRLLRKAIKSLHRRARLELAHDGANTPQRSLQLAVVSDDRRRSPPFRSLSLSDGGSSARGPSLQSVNLSAPQPAGGYANGWAAGSPSSSSYRVVDPELYRGTPFFERAERERYTDRGPIVDASPSPSPRYRSKNLEGLLKHTQREHQPQRYPQGQHQPQRYPQGQHVMPEDRVAGTRHPLLEEARNRYRAVVEIQRQRGYSPHITEAPHSPNEHASQKVSASRNGSAHGRRSLPGELAAPSLAAAAGELDADEILDGSTWVEWLHGEGHRSSASPQSTQQRREQHSTVPRTSTTEDALNARRVVRGVLSASSSGGGNAYLSVLPPTLRERISPCDSPHRANRAPSASSSRDRRTRSPRREQSSNAQPLVLHLHHTWDDEDDGPLRASSVIAPARYVSA